MSVGGWSTIIHSLKGHEFTKWMLWTFQSPHSCYVILTGFRGVCFRDLNWNLAFYTHPLVHCGSVTLDRQGSKGWKNMLWKEALNFSWWDCWQLSELSSSTTDTFFIYLLWPQQVSAECCWTWTEALQATILQVWWQPCPWMLSDEWWA